MDPFPLLTLPPDTLLKLLNRFKLGELFQLSQCSRKALNTVKTYSSSFDKTPFQLWVTTGPEHEVNMHRSDRSSSLEFTFYGERNLRRLYLQLPRTYNFHGQLIDFCKQGTGRRSRYGCATPHSTADIFKFAHYIKTLFNADLHALWMNVDDSILKKTLLPEWLLKSNDISIEGGVTCEEMVQVLECYDGVNGLLLCCSPGQYFSYYKTISTNYLWVNDATWIKRHNLLKLDCEYVNFHGSHLENKDLNAFLNHWLKSGDKKLKSMRVSDEEYDSEEERKNSYEFVQEEVLKGLPTLPGAPKRPDAIGAFRNRYTDTLFETGMDLRRESDGVLATVMVREEDYYGVTFTFVVWQEPNPNVVVVVP